MRRKSKLLMVFMAAAFFLIPGMESNAASEQTIHAGVYADQIDLGGMTEEDAALSINEYVDTLKNTQITLNTIGDNQVVITAGELGLTWSNPDIVSQAVTLGKSGNVIQRYKIMKDLENENKVYTIEFSVDQNVISDFITTQCEIYNIAAVDATLTRANEAFSIVDGQTGMKIQNEESVKLIVDALTNGWNHEPLTLDLLVEDEIPRGTTEELSKVKDLIGSFTTSFSTSATARSANVSNGCRLINGTILYPGDTFSTYEAVNPFTEANGYYMAGSYLNGMVVDSLGGGICQVSTTLYNAVLRAELEVTERSSHSMVVGYVDRSADAAISGTYKDFKFTNNSEYPIYIEGYTTSTKRLVFNIYGVETRPANREVVYESEILSTTEPEAERIIADAGQPVGFVDVQSAHTGYKAKLWKIVKVDGVVESRTEVNSSSYMQSPRTATIGVATDNPDLYNAVMAAIATGSIDYVKAVVAGGGAQPAAADTPVEGAGTAADATATTPTPGATAQ
ncbi:MAG: hypothetical protein HGA25_01940 [Clostridiales bacterium]|nr:hypothetical protein [Clostridiales bacterium]